jgi:hypothetical protein
MPPPVVAMGDRAVDAPFACIHEMNAPQVMKKLGVVRQQTMVGINELSSI